MGWGEIETEPEIDYWLDHLSQKDFGQAQFYIDLLEEKGVLLDEPYSRQLDRGLRELRFYIGRESYRISYYIATGRRIILLTVFAKSRRREEHEVQRAKEAMERCIREGHTAADPQ